MKLNLANPSAGMQKTIEIDDEKKLLPFFEKRMGAEVPGDSLGDEFKGYLFKISGGNDKQGFPMMQGVLVNHRVRLLFTKGMKCYRPRRTGEKKRKSVRGAIVGPDLSVLNLVLLKKGNDEIPGLTDGEKPRRLGPKRANRLRALFNLSKNDDVRKVVIRRQIEGKNKKKAPKIQRLITKSRIVRKKKLERRKIEKVQKSRKEAKLYQKVLHDYHHELKVKRAAQVAKKKKVDSKKMTATDSASNSKKGQTKNKENTQKKAPPQKLQNEKKNSSKK